MKEQKKENENLRQGNRELQKKNKKRQHQMVKVIDDRDKQIEDLHRMLKNSIEIN